nr:oligosaccharide flippase family protein [Pontibaca salina]
MRGEVLWAAAAKFGTGIFQFGISLLMARMLSVAAFGTFEFVLRTMSVVLVVSNLGLTWKSLMLASGGEPEEDASLGDDLSAVLGAALVSSTLMSVGFIAFMGATSGTDFAPDMFERVILTAMVPAFTLLLVISEAFRGLAKIRDASLFSGLFSNGIAFSVLLTFYLVSGDLTVVSGLMVLSVAASVAVATAFAVLRRLISNINLRFRWPEMAKQARESAPFAVYSVLVAVAATLDIWAVKLLFPIDQVGVYGIAARWSQFFLLPWMISSAVFRGRLASAIARNDIGRVHRIVAVNARVLGLIAVVLLLLIHLTSGALLRSVLPPEYTGSEPTLVLLAIAFSIQSTFSMYSLGLLLSSAKLLKFLVPLFQMAAFAALVGPLSMRLGLDGIGVSMLLAISAAAALQVGLFFTVFPGQRRLDA